MHRISSWVEVPTMVVFQTFLGGEVSTGSIYIYEGLCQHQYPPLVPHLCLTITRACGSTYNSRVSWVRARTPQQLKAVGNFWRPGVVWIGSETYLDSYSLRGILPSFNQKVTGMSQWDLLLLPRGCTWTTSPLTQEPLPPGSFFWPSFIYFAPQTRSRSNFISRVRIGCIIWLLQPLTCVLEGHLP